MNLDSVNNAGQVSLIESEVVLEKDKAVELPLRASAALHCWQLRVGEALTVSDPQANCWRARLECWSDEQIRVVPFEQLRQPVESRVSITVYQALPEKERFELILQKLTELGAVRIVPMQTARSTTVEERDAGQKKSHRWPEVIRKAARQCRRAMVPELAAVSSWEDVLNDLSANEMNVLFYEGEAPWSVSEALGQQQPLSIGLLIGPEGGFGEEEVAQARAVGVLPVSLGPRILRTETAAIAALAVVQFAAGDLDDN